MASGVRVYARNVREKGGPLGISLFCGAIQSVCMLLAPRLTVDFALHPFRFQSAVKILCEFQNFM